MATGSRPDPKRRGQKHAHATYFKIANGTKEHGYMAGQLFGCYGHRIGAQQPCHSDLTSDQLECPYCKAGMAPVWRGYVPVWDRDWTLRYALIGEDIFESVDSLQHGEQVELSRAKNPISPLIVRPGVGFVRKLPDRAPWSVPVNMFDICLTLWQCEPVTSWYARNPKQKPSSDKPVSLPTQSNGKPFDPMHAAAARRYTAPDPTATMDQEYDKVVADLAKKSGAARPSTNGKRPH